METEKKLSKTQKEVYERICKEYQERGECTFTNRQFGKWLNRTPRTIQFVLRELRTFGLIDSNTIVDEDSGYVIRYITPISEN